MVYITQFASTPFEGKTAELYEYWCPNAPWYTGYDTVACVLFAFLEIRQERIHRHWHPEDSYGIMAQPIVMSGRMTRLTGLGSNDAMTPDRSDELLFREK